MDRIAAMKAFVRIVEAGSFTRAAFSVGSSKAGLTKLMKQLEDELKTQLLTRTTRRVTVTSAGAAYYQRVVRLLSDLEELETGVSAARSQPSGRLRVDVGASVGPLLVIPALAGFHARYPEIRLELGVSDREVDMMADNVDCVVRMGELSDSSLIARRIGDMRFITCASPHYLKRHGMPMHPRDLEQRHAVVSCFSPRTGRQFPLDFTLGGERIEIEGQHTLAVNDSNACLAAGLAGLGVVQVPAFAADAAVRQGRLIPVLANWRCEPLPVHVVYPPNRFQGVKLRAFVDWVAELFAQHRLVQREMPALPSTVAANDAAERVLEAAA